MPVVRSENFWLTPAIDAAYRTIMSPRVMAVLLVTGFALMGGCRESTSTEHSADASSTRPTLNRVATKANLSPAAFLRSTLRRYRGAAVYRDRGELVATGPTATVIAPMAVHSTRRGMRVQAYAATVWFDAERMIAWIDDEDRPKPQTKRRPTQVLVVERKDQNDQALLAGDAILHAAVTGGAGGPPPQLDWLLAAKPMEHLFDSANQFSFAPDAVVERRRCEVVRVESGGETFAFYIDTPAGLIRRIDLPPVPTADGDDEIELTIRLRDATFDAAAIEPLTPTELAIPEPAVWVKRMIAEPPILHRRIGSRIEPSRLPRFDAPAAWVMGETSQSVRRYFQQLRGRGLEVAEQSGQSVTRWPILSSESVDASDSDGELWLIDAAGKIHFVQSLQPPILPDALMAATLAVADGQDVAENLLRTSLADTQRYRESLRSVTVASPLPR